MPKGQRGGARAGSPFVPGHGIQPTPDQRNVVRRGVAGAMRRELATIPPDEVVGWIREAVALARERSDAKAMLTGAELVILYQVGKPREQLSERDGIDMLAVIEQAAAQMRERTIDGAVVEEEREREEEDKRV